MNQARAHTSTRNPVLRLLYVGIKSFSQLIILDLHTNGIISAYHDKVWSPSSKTWTFKTMLNTIINQAT